MHVSPSEDIAVQCIVYRNGAPAGEIPIADISEALKQEGSFVWLALHEPDTAVLRQIQEEFALHDLAVEDTQVAHQRPKLEEYGESLFVVVKTIQLQEARLQFGEAHAFVGERYIAYISHGLAVSFDGVRERFEAAPRALPRGPGFALYALMDYVVDQYVPVSDYFESRVQRLEEGIFKGRFDRAAIERLYDLKRDLVELRNAGTPMLEVLMQLMRFHREIIPKDIRVYFRDVHDHLTRMIEASDRMQEMLTAAMQVNLALVTVGQNEAVKRLAGWGAILAIPTVVFSLYGMNFHFMPELGWRFGYPLVLAGTVTGCVLLYWKLKRAEWL